MHFSHFNIQPFCSLIGALSTVMYEKSRRKGMLLQYINYWIELLHTYRVALYLGYIHHFSNGIVLLIGLSSA